MKDSRNVPTRRSAQSGQFVLTSGRGEKISAVEGMRVTTRMGQILAQSGQHGMTGDERRTLIREQIRKK